MKILKLYIIAIMTFSPHLSGEAQEVRILGQVVYQNSKCNTCDRAKPVEGVYVRATMTNKVKSDNRGRFTLKFMHSDIGDPVKISIGINNIENLGNNEFVELVNAKELNQVNIPSDPFLEESQIKIVICPKGERDKWAMKHYNILYKSINDERLRRLEQQNKALKNEKSKVHVASNKRIKLLERRIAELEKPLDSINIRNNAFNIASLNKDDVSDEMKQFIIAIEQGKTIKEALKFLDRIKAAERLNSITSKPSRRELEVIAEQSREIYDYETAIECYTDLISYAQGERLDKGIIAGYYQNKCLNQESAGQTLEGIESCKKALSNFKKIGLSPSAIGWQIGTMYERIEKYDEAVTHYKSIVATNKLSEFPNESIIGFTYMALIKVYYKNKDFSSAKAYLEFLKKESPAMYNVFRNFNNKIIENILSN
jgi:tetratricopeptide (TPR) repeat protein